MKNVRTFADLSATLVKRAAAIKSGSVNGSQKKAGEESGQTEAVPERDDRAKGTVAIPKDPDAAPAKAVGLERQTNAEVTAPFALSPDKTVTGEEKPATAASLSKKAQDIASSIRGFAASLSKKAEVGSDGKSVTPNMPPNTQVNTGTTPDAKNQPPSGGTAKGNNPDANAKTSGASMNAEGEDKEKKVSLPAGDSKGNIPDSKTNTDATKHDGGQAAVESKAAAAGGTKIATVSDPLLKLASFILSQKGGEQWLVNSIGADTAALIKTAAEEKCKGCGMLKTACTCKSATKEQGDKMAAADDFVIDSSYHVKLASLILSTEEGRQFAQRQIEKAHGAEAASDIVKAAAYMEERAIEMARIEAQGAFEAEEMWKQASPDERQKIIKLARVHTTARNQFATDLEKTAYDAGAMMGAQMGDAGMLGGAAAGTGPDAGAPGAPAGLPPGAGAEAAGGMGGEAGGGDLSPDAVIAALDQMVSSGELTPELAAEVLQAIMGGGAGGAGGEAGGAGGAAGGMPGAEAGGAGAMPGGMPGMPGAGGGAPAAGGGGGEAEKGGEKKEEPKKEESEKESKIRASVNEAVAKGEMSKSAAEAILKAAGIATTAPVSATTEDALIKRAHEIALLAMAPVTAKAA
jgi:hypothetical protein